MELHEYQKRCVNYMWQHSHCVLSVDMGLGKTISVLTYLDFLLKRDKGRHHGTLRGIIVAPKRVAENNWMQEAEKWGLDNLAKLIVVVKGTKNKRDEAINRSDKPIKVISRDNINDISGYGQCDFLVIDELTSFKNIESKRTRVLMSIDADRKIGLTGTFLANGAIDIYAQCRCVGLDGGFASFYGWRGHFFRDALAGSGLAFHKWKLRVPLAEVLEPYKNNIFTLTADDYLEIPDVTHRTHKVALGMDERKAYDEMQTVLCCKVGDEVLTFDEGQKFAKLQTLCNGFVYVDNEDTGEREVVRGAVSSKLSAVADYVESAVAEGEQVLLFYAFVEEEKWLTEMLMDRGIDVHSVRENDFLAKWNNGDCQVLMAHPASAGHGLNLQHGGRVIVWSSITYNYEFYAQANARLARQGQRNKVIINYFVAKETQEEAMVMALERKQEAQDRFLKITKK